MTGYPCKNCTHGTIMLGGVTKHHSSFNNKAYTGRLCMIDDCMCAQPEA